MSDYHVNGIIRKTEYQMIKEELLNPKIGEVVYEAGKPRRVIPDLAPIYVWDKGYVAHHFTHRYAGDILTEKLWMSKLNPQTAEFLLLQTGCGKTTLAISGLAKYLYGKRKRLAIFMSRSALKLKTKCDAIRETESESDNNDVVDIIRKQLKSKYGGEGVDMGKDMALAELIKGLDEFGNIDIYSYQDIYGERVSSKHREKIETMLRKYGAVIFDETHFFVSDADFNVYTEKIFYYLTEIFYKTPRIYMTGTPEYVFDRILDREKELKSKHKPIIEVVHGNISPYYNCSPKPVLNLYYFDRDYSYINYHTFTYKKTNDFSEIVSRINNSSKVKWLVFLDNKDLGGMMKSKIKDKNVAVLNSDMLHGTDKNESSGQDVDKLMWSLTMKEKLPDDVDVLITTKCLDVGITIKDNPLNIVCFLNDPVDFIQAVGRKRICNKDDIVNLYIPYYPNGTINKWLNQAKRKYGVYAELRRYQGMTANGTNFLPPSYVENGVCQFNDFAFVKIMEQMAIFEEMAKQTDEGEEDGKVIARHFARLMELVHKLGFDVKEDVYSEAEFKELKEIVEDYSVSPITEEQRKELIEKIKKFDSRERRDRNMGAKEINKILGHVGYRIGKITTGKQKGLYQFKQVIVSSAL